MPPTTIEGDSTMGDVRWVRTLTPSLVMASVDSGWREHLLPTLTSHIQEELLCMAAVQEDLRAA